MTAATSSPALMVAPRPPAGVGQHYWTVTLTPPAQASVALQQFVAMGQAAIQAAGDLLGRGATEPPPVVDDLLQTVIYEDLGSGTASSDYQALLSAIEQRKATLMAQDQQVMKVSAKVAAATDDTLAYIQTVVSELQSEFSSIKGKLSAPEETALMTQIGDAIDLVNARVTTAYEVNQAHAGTGSGGGSGSGSSSTGSGGGGGGGSNPLSSIMEILPMLLAPLASLGPELVKELTKALQAGQPAPGASGPSQPAPILGNPPPTVKYTPPPPPGGYAIPAGASAPAVAAPAAAAPTTAAPATASQNQS
jgi:hypothetical protein